MARIGLVLGAGGIVGQAYEAGVLAALEHDLGWDPRTAEVIVGSSAGSVTGALLRLGVPAEDLAAFAVEAPLMSMEAQQVLEQIGTGPPDFPKMQLRDLTRGWRVPSPALLVRSARRPLAFRPTTAAATLLPRGKVDIAERAAVLNAVAGEGWPEGLWVCIARRSDGHRVVLGREGSPHATLAEGVAASCAIPGYFSPVRIDGVEYFDGGVYSPTNADVLKRSGLDLVLVVSPMSAVRGKARGPDAAFRWSTHRRLAGEVRQLKQAGTEVVRFEPGRASLAAMGVNAMAEDRSAPVVQAAFFEAGRHASHHKVIDRLTPIRTRRPRPAPPALGSAAMADVHGFVDDRFTAVRDAFASNFDEGLDVGASACVIVADEVVVDIWGGHVGPEHSAPWERDTITNVWSTTKTMTALCALLLADRGELDLHAPVARYWPEFAANGKEAVEVRHLLGHTAGLSGWQEPLAPEDLYDWDLCCSRLAAQAPWWEPGTASGYHALTQGYLIGEVVRRVTGQSLGTFLAKELAGPLDADFHVGLAAEHDHRVSRVIPPPPLPIAEMEPGSVAARTFTSAPLDAAQSWEEAWRRAEIPAAGGHGNARSVAMVQSVLSHGGERNGSRFMSPPGCDAVFEEQARGIDLVLGAPLRLGIGYGISSPETPIGRGERTCFWGGWGGSIVVNDLDARMTVAYVMNRMGEGTLGDLRGAKIVLGAYASLP